jgi:hypothetical protein
VFGTLTAAGHTLLWVGFLAAAGASRPSNLPWDARLELVLAGLATALVGGVTLAYSQPRSAKDPVRALIQDRRPPVLYLRSFTDDRAAAAVDPVRDADRAAVPGIEMIEIDSREQLLATVLGSLGPVVTVGLPHERIPPLGATRLYLPAGDWQPRVVQLMDLSSLVVIRLGEGASLWWEFAYCVSHLPAHKVIVLLPGAPLPVGLVEELNRQLPLPSGLDAVVARSGDPWVSAVLSFDPSWRPQATAVGPLPGSRRNLSPGYELACALQQALKRVGIRRRALGFRIARPRLAMMGKILLLLALFLGLHIAALVRQLAGNA